MNTVPDWLAYDEVSDAVIVDGCKFDRAFLTQITTSPPGIRFAVDRREGGIITIRTERNELEAAAPEMLEALKAILHPDNAALVYFVPSDAWAMKLKADALTIIARATGAHPSGDHT